MSPNTEEINKKKDSVAVSCGYNTCFAVKACDELYHLTKSMDRIGTPLGFQSIVWTFVRHTVSRCLIVPALPEMAKVTIGFLQFLPTGQHGLCFGYLFSGPLTLHSLIHGPPSMDRIGTPLGFQSIVWTFVRHTVSRCLIFPALPEMAKVTIGFLQFLSTGQHGLCFGYLFSGPPTLHSLIHGPPFGVRFQESLVIRLYSEIDQIHLSIEAQCGTACSPLGDCHR